MHKTKISLWMAVVINLNVMIGAGVFINPPLLTSIAGVLGFLSYVGVALIVLPLVLSVAELSKLYPKAAGGLYVYSKEAISPLAGIISGGSYFIGKSVSCAVLVQTVAIYLHHLLPFFHLVPIVVVALLIMAILCVLNTLGIRFSSRVQLGFIFFKLLPIVFVIGLVFWVFNIEHFQGGVISLGAFSASLPVAMYAFLGFEACCAIGHTITNSHKNLSRSLVISFLVAALVYTSFQFSLFSGIGMPLADAAVPLDAFLQLFSSTSPFFIWLMRPIFNSAVMVAVLGSCYGILFTNMWNGYALATELSGIRFSRFFFMLNSHGVPAYSTFLQGAIASLLLVIGLKTVTLARIAVLSIAISYCLSTLALIASYRQKKQQISLPFWVAVLGLGGAVLIAATCIKGFF